MQSEQFKQLQKFVDHTWDTSITPTLVEYIKIPNKSPDFDREWAANGMMDQAVELIANWCKEHAPKNIRLDVLKLEGRTPLIFIEIPGQTDDTVLLYGHLDKQPEMEGWDDDLGPWKPVIKDDKLYGRGGADDGYAAFASLTAINALQEQNIPHARCVLIIEASEESGSPDLPYYVEHLQERIGNPSLVVCLDSGCGNYDRLWATTSLRGMVAGVLTAKIIKKGLHSGYASGIVPSSFRIIRQLLDRLENPETGEILLDALKVDIPKRRVEQAEETAHILGDRLYKSFPFVANGRPTSTDLTTLLLHRTWCSTLSITGAAGIPLLENAGNVLRPQTSLKLSFRLPPTCDHIKASKAIKKILEENPPYGAEVEFVEEEPNPGWNAPLASDWLQNACNNASNNSFGAPAASIGEGGSIPFMGMLGEKFPKAEFLITGILGPKSNAHGPNEFLHLPAVKKVTACVGQVLAEHYQRNL